MKLNLEVLKQELVIDKFIDFVLIFVGLYAAIAFQKWQDDAKERTEYKKLLGDFKAELRANQERKRTIEKNVGDTAARGVGKALGPLQTVFDEYLTVVAEGRKLFECLEPVFPESAGAKGKPMTKECQKLLASAEEESKAEDDEDFRPVDLAPRYRTEVHQVYLANGIKVFENKNLAVKIGEVYTAAREIEAGMADIERRYNDSFMQKAGEVEALSAQIEEVFSTELVTRRPEQVRERLTDMSEDLRSQRYVVVEIRKVVEAKVIRIKEMVARFDAQLTTVMGEIDAELARLK
ncbi:MAG TPA: hypothetical protein VGF45_03010 [Polyangia bacterium]